MKTKSVEQIRTVILAGLFLLAFSLTGCTKEEEPAPATGTDQSTKEALMNYTVVEPTSATTAQCIGTFPVEPLSEDEIIALTIMREEEYLAHDVYLTLSQLYTKPIFRNITKSEMVHTEAIKALIVKYNLPDPAAGHVTGTFTNPELQSLYNTLVQSGSQSLLDGLTVGATIEDLDIVDLRNHLLLVDNRDIKFVFTNLERGSRNHLRAFYANILFMGGTYTPQYLTQAEFDAIINSNN